MNKLNEENNLNQEEKNAALTDEEIMQAEDRYLFNRSILYVVMDREKDVHRFYRGAKKWNFKENANFWDSWDCNPFVFDPINGEEAVKLVHEWLSENETGGEIC